MRLARVSRTLAPVLLVGALAPCAVQAETTLPVGESNGIRIVREQRAITIVFTPRAESLYRGLAGRTVRVGCAVDTRYPWHDAGGVSAWLEAPEHGRRLRTGFRSRRADRWDYCRVERAAYRVRKGNSVSFFEARRIASIPITQRGAVYLDERAKALLLQRLLGFADLRLTPDPSRTEISPEQLADAGAAVGRLRIAALSSPDATPPAGTIGYYSDGTRFAAVIVSAAGRRLFLEAGPDDVIRTNVAYYLQRRDATS